MMSKRDKIIYWVATGLLMAMTLMSAMMYIFTYEDISAVFGTLGYPVYIIYPLAVAKILAVVAILTKKSIFLKQLAYAGLFYDFLLAFSAHIKYTIGIIPIS